MKGKTPADELRACSRALDWLQFYDGLDARLRRERDYDIMPYIPYSFVAWNPIFAAVANKTPEWPRVDYEVRLPAAERYAGTQGYPANDISLL